VKAMKINVRLVGRYRNLSDSKELLFDLKEGDTIWHIIDVFVSRFPEVKKDKKFIMVTKNKTFTPRKSTIQANDEITIIPPVVSGG
jgi:molybdopterin converting factor small subunit